MKILILWAVFGAVIGVVAKLILDDRAGFFLFMMFGAGGAVITGVLGLRIDLYDPWSAASIITGVVGAVAFIAFYRCYLSPHNLPR